MRERVPGRKYIGNLPHSRIMLDVIMWCVSEASSQMQPRLFLSSWALAPLLCPHMIERRAHAFMHPATRNPRATRRYQFLIALPLSFRPICGDPITSFNKLTDRKGHLCRMLLLA